LENSFLGSFASLRGAKPSVLTGTETEETATPETPTRSGDFVEDLKTLPPEIWEKVKTTLNVKTYEEAAEKARNDPAAMAKINEITGATDFPDEGQGAGTPGGIQEGSPAEAPVEEAPAEPPKPDWVKKYEQDYGVPYVWDAKERRWKAADGTRRSV
jgi:hypothetical protein